MTHRRRIATVLAVQLALAVSLSAQLPDSPTGRRGNAIIAVLRGGPEAATATFFEENFAPDLLAVISATVTTLR